jgi:hypothetical protein
MALNRKQRVFVEEYLTCWNATEAARRANYAHPDVQGSRLLGKVSVSEVVQQRMREKAMGADEVLLRLGEHARAEYALFLTPQGLDIKALIAAGKAHLIRKWGYASDGRPVFEFQDSQNALIHIGRHHKLFTDVTENTTTLNVEGLEQLMDRVYGTGDTDSTD